MLRAARTICGKISKLEGIVGITAGGGLGRGHCDGFSDLDLTVYANHARVKELDRYIAVGGLRYKGIELDTPVESYEKALSSKSPSRYWSQVTRWDRENSQILYDTDDRIKSLLEAKLIFPDWEQKKLMKKHAQGVTDRLIYEFELWQKRGTPLNLAHMLIRASEHLILWVYAMNKRFQPYTPKWLFYHLENGFVPEAKYLSTIKKPYVCSVRTIKEACSIRDDLIRLADRLGVPFEYRSVGEVFDEEEANWKKASDKTKRFLSW
jgi:hypothetical protein